MVNREAPVSLKSLHNLQTKMNDEIIKTGPDDLSSMIDAMKKVLGAKFDVVYDNSKNELIGIYFGCSNGSNFRSLS